MNEEKIYTKLVKENWFPMVGGFISAILFIGFQLLCFYTYWLLFVEK